MNSLIGLKQCFLVFFVSLSLGCGVKGPPVPYVSLEDDSSKTLSNSSENQPTGTRTQSEKVKK